MKMFIDWVSDHVLTTLLILGSAYSILYVVSNRRTLFYKK